MSNPSTIIHGGSIFDGSQLHENTAALFQSGRFKALSTRREFDAGNHFVDLDGDILIPGYVDLQVNGGGGVLFNDAPCVETLTRMAITHQRLGASTILPTLISDSPAKTRLAIEAAIAAIDRSLPGIAGLHLEGPHLCIAKKGAHDAQFIRPMNDIDLQQLLKAKQSLPVLKVTVAPESVPIEFVKILSEAGVIVSLGHTDAGFETCCEYFDAGASCVTHLFNAMSQFNSRQPGLVGAVLNSSWVYSGLIADGHHVHPDAMRLAFNTQTRHSRVFLVSDAMAVAGTDRTDFLLGERTINRREGRLSLDDGTLAGADLNLTQAIKTLVAHSGVSLTQALQAAITVPAKLIDVSVSLTTDMTELTSMYRLSASLDRINLLDVPR